MAIDFGKGLGGAASATPMGAAASVLGAAVSTPTSSASGPASTGWKNFGNKIGGISLGGGVPIWAIVAVAALIALVLIKRK